MPEKPSRFTIRVYGILIHDDAVLLSDEKIRGRMYTKFPGGGMEPGEGVIDCLKREFIEELRMEIQVKEHFYTTDFFVRSAFDPALQVISLYYLVQPLHALNGNKEKITRINFDEDQSFRWVSRSLLNEDDFELVIDKHVATLLKQEVRVC